MAGKLAVFGLAPGRRHFVASLHDCRLARPSAFFVHINGGWIMERRRLFAFILGLSFLFLFQRTNGDDSEDTPCKTVLWISSSGQDTLEECWPLNSDTYWYGGGDGEKSVWPLTFDDRSEVPEVTGGNNGDVNRVHHRYWINSDGYSFRVHDDVPLFTSVRTDSQTSTKAFCLAARHAPPYSTRTRPFKLSYTTCQGSNPKDVFVKTMDTVMKKPDAPPLEWLIGSPVFSTWPALPDETLKTRTLIDFLSNMMDLDPHVQGRRLLRILGNWEGCTGELQFHSVKFPNPKELMDTLSISNTSVALQVTPFHDVDCGARYDEGASRGYFVRNADNGSVQTHLWNNRTVVMVDFTNAEASDWWRSALTQLQTAYGVKSFFLDEGQASHLTQGYAMSYDTPEELQPDIYTTLYAESLSSLGIDGMSTSVGRLSQHLPYLVQMKGLTHDDWSGLREVIPRALRLGLLGFPFVLPDVAGGSLGQNRLPDPVLYIRWVQVNVFMPSMHFSIGPWEYDAKTVVMDAVKQAVSLRKNYEPLLMSLAAEASANGLPIVRPLWWASPYDSVALACNDQFLVGNDVLVAPILDPSGKRTIYLPTGKWKDTFTEQTYNGPHHLVDYEARIDQVPVFVKA